MENVLELFDGVYQTGRWPVGVYPGLAALRPHVPRSDRLRRHRAGRGADVAPPLADLRARRRLRGGALRLHPLVLALRPAPLLRRLGLTSESSERAARVPPSVVRQRGLGRDLPGVFLFFKGGLHGTTQDSGAQDGAERNGQEQGPRDLECGRTTRGAEANPGRGRRARPLLVHRSRGPPEVIRDHSLRDGGGAERRHGVRRLVDHGLQRDRGVRHGRHSRSGELPAHAAAARRARTCDRREGRPHDLRRRDARRRAVRG